MRLLLLSGLRELRRHPAQLALALAGVALGVAVGVAVDLANESARRAFRLSTEAISGRATHVVVAGSGGLDETLLARLRAEASARAAAPVVDGFVTIAGAGTAQTPAPRLPLRLLGVDPFSEAAFRPFVADGVLGDPEPGRAGERGALERWLLEPGAVALTGDTADELGLEVGESFPALAGPKRVELHLAGRIDPKDELARTALASVAIADIATAQELLERAGRLDRIELVVPGGTPGDALLGRIGALLPPDARLEPVGARTAAIERLTRSFRFNLRALALLALLCGAFLVYNTTTFAVVRRRDLYGRLRASGVGRGELIAAVVGEAALVGALGSLAGVALGVLLGRGLTALVLTTVSDLYFTVTVRGAALPLPTLFAGFALGTLVSIVAALPPALEAATSPLRAALAASSLEGSAAALAGRAALGGLAVGAIGALLIAVSGRNLPALLAGFLLLVLGATLLVPWALGAGMRGAGLLPGLTLRQAVRGVERSLARTAPAVAALAVAVAVSLAVAVTIASFRGAVVGWLESTLIGDLYLSAPIGGGGPSASLPTELGAALAALDGVARVQTLHVTQLPRDPTSGADVAPTLLAVDLDPVAFSALELKEGDPERARAALTRGSGALVSEPLAERRGLVLGGRIAVPTPSGELDLEIVGIYVDYGSERGAIVVGNPLFVARFPDSARANFALHLAPGADADAVTRAARAAAAPLTIEIRSSRELRRLSLEIFDRTFQVTSVLRLLALVVAALGIAAALAALELQRAKQFALLRALGATRATVAGIVVAECGALGLAAGIAALPIGAGLASLLVGVVQRRSFGWSFPLALTPRPFVESVALAVGAALVAGVVAALRVAHRAPVEALREE